MIPSRLISITIVPRPSSGLLLAPRIAWCVRRNVLAVVLILLNIVYYSYCCLHQCTYFDVVNVISYESGIFCLHTGYVLWLLWLQVWSDYRFRLQVTWDCGLVACVWCALITGVVVPPCWRFPNCYLRYSCVGSPVCNGPYLHSWNNPRSSWITLALL